MGVGSLIMRMGALHYAGPKRWTLGYVEYGLLVLGTQNTHAEVCLRLTACCKATVRRAPLLRASKTRYIELFYMFSRVYCRPRSVHIDVFAGRQAGAGCYRRLRKPRTRLNAMFPAAGAPGCTQGCQNGGTARSRQDGTTSLLKVTWRPRQQGFSPLSHASRMWAGSANHQLSRRPILSPAPDHRRLRSRVALPTWCGLIRTGTR